MIARLRVSSLAVTPGQLRGNGCAVIVGTASLACINVLLKRDFSPVPQYLSESSRGQLQLRARSFTTAGGCVSEPVVEATVVDAACRRRDETVVGAPGQGRDAALVD